MQDDSYRRTPPILFARPTYEWISRVNQRRQQLAEIEVSADSKTALDRWMEIEFVYSTIKLEGAEVSREEVARIVSSTEGAASPDEKGRAIEALLKSLRMLTALTRDQGKAAVLTVDLLLKLHNIQGAAAGLRTTEGDTSGFARPVPPESLSAVLENACQWYTAESFDELHPVEQASIVFLRLLEIQPFEQANQRSALLAASLFTLRSGLPPLILKPGMDSAYRRALEEGRRMNTKPMVELLAEAVEASISEMINKIKEGIEN